MVTQVDTLDPLLLGGRSGRARRQDRGRLPPVHRYRSGQARTDQGDETLGLQHRGDARGARCRRRSRTPRGPRPLRAQTGEWRPLSAGARRLRCAMTSLFDNLHATATEPSAAAHLPSTMPPLGGTEHQIPIGDEPVGAEEAQEIAARAAAERAEELLAGLNPA